MHVSLFMLLVRVGCSFGSYNAAARRQSDDMQALLLMIVCLFDIKTGLTSIQHLLFRVTVLFFKARNTFPWSLVMEDCIPTAD